VTKLSKQLPEFFSFTRSNWSAWGKWLKELAEYVEFIDRREQGLREEATYKKKFEATYAFAPVIQKEYEPQTYDEAIGLCKGWPRTAFGYDISWERDNWPELWKEMSRKYDCVGHLYFHKDEWALYFPSGYRDSTPGRVVCQAYLCFRNHPDWAKRLSKND